MSLSSLVGGMNCRGINCPGLHVTVAGRSVAGRKVVEPMKEVLIDL